MRARGWAMPAPRLPRYVVAMTSAEAAGLALIAATTCPAVELSAPELSVPRETEISLSVTATLSGWFAAPGLRNSAWTWLPPSWPQSLVVSTTAEWTTSWTWNVKSPRSPWKPETS